MWTKRLLAFLALGVVIAAVAVVVRGRPGPGPDRAGAHAPAPTPHTRNTRHARPTPTPLPGEVHGAAARRMPVPILMYHVISKAPAGVPNAQLWVDRHVFADEMRALRAAKLQPITPQHNYYRWNQGGSDF